MGKLERILAYGAVLLLLLFGAKGCFDTSKLEGQLIEQKKQITELKKEYKKAKEAFVVTKDSLTKDTEKKNDSLNQLRKENKVLASNILAHKNKNKQQKKELENYKNKDYVDLFNKYYKTNSAVETEKGVDLQNELPKKVAETIFDTEMYKNQLGEAYQTIENQKQEIKLEQGKTLNAEIERDQTAGLLDKSEELNEKHEQFSKNAEKTISKLKTQKIFMQVALPVGIVVGVVTGILITK